MNFKKLIFLIIFLISANYVFAITITANPETIIFKNILPGGYAEQILKIRSDSINPVQITISAPESIKQWFSFEPKSASVSKEHPAEFKIILQPASNTTLGNYETYLIINTISSGNKVTSSMTTAIDIRTTIEITDTEIIQANIQDISLKDTEIGIPIKVLIEVKNEGNIELPLFTKIDVLDQDKVILTSLNTPEISILPSSIKIIGKYTAQIQVYSNEMLVGKQTLSFNVVKKGALPKEEIILQEPKEKPIPLSTSMIILIIWALILIFVVYAIKDNKPKNRKK
jgi:hypothetical protein